MANSEGPSSVVHLGEHLLLTVLLRTWSLPMYFVAAYDVDESRVGKMLEIFRKYLTWVQNSVFEGELTEAQFAELKTEASELMDTETDSVIFWNVRAEQYCDRETLGMEKGQTGRLL